MCVCVGGGHSSPQGLSYASTQASRGRKGWMKLCQGLAEDQVGVVKGQEHMAQM